MAAKAFGEHRRLSREERDRRDCEIVLPPPEHRIVEVDQTHEPPSSVTLRDQQMPGMQIPVQERAAQSPSGVLDQLRQILRESLT